VVLPGFKYNMTDIQAALGICQLSRLHAMQCRRREIADAYGQAFRQCDELETPATRPDVLHAWHLYVIRLRRGTLRIGRAQFIDRLTERKIGTSVHFIPIHLHPYYRNKYGYSADSFPVAYDSYDRMLSLPLNPTMTDQDVADVIESVCDIVRDFRAMEVAA